MSFLLGENGLLNKAIKGKTEEEKAEAREKLEITLANAYIEKYTNEKYNQNEFLDDFIYEEQPEAEVMDEEISLDGYTFELDRSVPRLMEYIGESGNLPARIRKIDVVNKTLSSVTIEVTAARAEKVNYRYSLKKQNEEQYAVDAEQNSNTYTFDDLESMVIYNIKVDIIQSGEVIDTKEINVRLGEIEEGVLTFGEETWNGNGTANVVVKTTTNEQIQYQINGIDGQWITINNGGTISNIANNSNVYARLYDGKNESDYISTKIIDEDKPTLVYKVDTETMGAQIVTITITAMDDKSGIASITTPTEEKTVTGSTATIEYSVTENGEYIFKAKDNAGNISEELKVNITNIAVVKEFNYTGEMQTFIVPEDGKYKIEVYGSQVETGLSSYLIRGSGGRGGYSAGDLELEKGTELYIFIGNMTGYNGGAGNRTGGRRWRCF